METALNSGVASHSRLAVGSTSGEPRLAPELHGHRESATIWTLSSDLRSMRDSEPSLIAELLSLFLSDSAERLRTLCDACKGQEFQVVRAQAHSLKGSALQMGATHLASLCGALELTPTAQPEQYAVLSQTIQDEFALVSSVIKEYMSDRRTTGVSLSAVHQATR